MEIMHIVGNTGVVDIGGTCTGIYKLNNEEIAMIDSGRKFSPELFAMLNRRHMRVAAVIHTHIHIDHVANTDEIMKRYGAEMWAAETEIKFHDHEYETCECELRGNIPNGSVAVTDKDGKEHLFETVFSPGHSEGHQLVITPDGVCFLGDSIISPDILAASKMPFQMDAMLSLKSMETIRKTKFPFYVASHFGRIPAGELEHVLELNEDKSKSLYRLLYDTAAEPMRMDELAEKFMIRAGVTNPAVREQNWMQLSAVNRIMNLIYKGMFVEDGEFIRQADGV